MKLGVTGFAQIARWMTLWAEVNCTCCPWAQEASVVPDDRNGCRGGVVPHANLHQDRLVASEQPRGRKAQIARLRTRGNRWRGNGNRMLSVARSLAIAYLAGAFPLSTETFVYEEVNELRRRGWQVTTVSLHRPKSELPQSLSSLRESTVMLYSQPPMRGWGIISECVTHPLRTMRTVLGAGVDALMPGETTSVRLRAKLVGQALMAVALARELRARNVEHIHCHFSHAPTTIGMFAAKQLGIGFSFVGHANDLFVRRALLRRKLERAKFVACISEYHQGLYSEVHPEGRDKYPIIRCGVDVSKWARSERRGTEDSARRCTQILTLGRLVEKKGVDLLIEAVAQMIAAGHSVQLTVAGDGPQRAGLERLAKGLGIDGSVAFLGAVSHDRIAELMAQADIFALPCRTAADGDRDGIPVVVMEAMASALPVVVGDLPAIRELVANGVSGRLVRQGDVMELATSLVDLAVNPSVRVAMGLAGRKRVAEEFSAEANVSRLEDALAMSWCGH